MKTEQTRDPPDMIALVGEKVNAGVNDRPEDVCHGIFSEHEEHVLTDERNGKESRLGGKRKATGMEQVSVMRMLRPNAVKR